MSLYIIHIYTSTASTKKTFHRWNNLFIFNSKDGYRGLVLTNDNVK